MLSEKYWSVLCNNFDTEFVMKKAAILFLVFLYLLPATGFSMAMHVCGGKVTSVKIENFSSGDCTCGVKKMKGGCCKNVQVTFKITDIQKTAAELTFSKNESAKEVFESSFPVQFVSYLQPDDFEVPNYHAPPPDGKRPVYLNNRVFRI